MLAGSLRERPGNRCGEKAGRLGAANKADANSAANSWSAPACLKKSLFLHGPRRRTGPKGQAALEYYLLLLGIALVALVALSWSSDFASGQKNAHEWVFLAVERVENSTLAKLAPAEPVEMNSSGETGGLSISIFDYSPYWAGHPALFRVEVFNSGQFGARIGELRVRVRDPDGANIPVSPECEQDFSIAFAHSSSFTFSPNIPGMHEIEASIHDGYGAVLIGSDGYPLTTVKEVQAIG